MLIVGIIFLLSGSSILAQTKKPVVTQYRSVTITSQPGSTVWIDGVLYGKTGEDGRLEVKTVSSGPHVLLIRADGYKEKSQPLTAAQKGEIKITLAQTDDAAELAFQEAERLAGEDRQKSADAYRKAVQNRPTYAEAYLGLARVLASAGEPDDAAKAIASARRGRRSYAEASAVEGRIHKDNGDEDKSIAAFKRAITEARGFQPEAYTGLGLLYKEKAEGFGGGGDFANEDASYAEASKNLKIALKQLSGAPDAMVIYQLLGLIYERQKKYTEAISTYEEFLRFFPDTIEATAVRSFIIQLNKDMAQQE